MAEPRSRQQRGSRRFTSGSPRRTKLRQAAAPKRADRVAIGVGARKVPAGMHVREQHRAPGFNGGGELVEQGLQANGQKHATQAAPDRSKPPAGQWIRAEVMAADFRWARPASAAARRAALPVGGAELQGQKPGPAGSHSGGASSRLRIPDLPPDQAPVHLPQTGPAPGFLAEESQKRRAAGQALRRRRLVPSNMVPVAANRWGSGIGVDGSCSGVQPLRLILQGNSRSASSFGIDVVGTGRGLVSDRGSDFAGRKPMALRAFLGDVVGEQFLLPPSFSFIDRLAMTSSGRRL